MPCDSAVLFTSGYVLNSPCNVKANAICDGPSANVAVEHDVPHSIIDRACSPHWLPSQHVQATFIITHVHAAC